jgi:nitrous oxidase accessory protein NosD
MISNRFIRLTGALVAPVLATGVLVAQAGVASASAQWFSGKTLFVAPSGNPNNDGRSCHSAGFSTIQSAVNAAPDNATIIACAGTYHEQVVISKPVSLAGLHATVDESGVTPTFTITLPGLGQQTIFAAVIVVSSHVTLKGFTIQHAEGEGVLAAGLSGALSGIVISHNAVVHNDLGGGVPPKSTCFQCAAHGQVPGDCDEGVHFAGNVAFSAIRDNFIAFNSGGVLLSDDIGPTHNNMVEGSALAVQSPTLSSQSACSTF